MAAPKKEVVTEIDETQKLKEANEKLNTELAEMKKMMMDFMAEQTKQKEAVKPETKVSESDDTEFEIPMNKVVKVISTTYGGMTLRSAETGGKTYRFTDFGIMQPIIYSDLLGIISNHPKFTQEGYFMILDSKVVMASGLSSFYDKFLSKERILGILELPTEDIVEIFKTTTKHVQETILETIYKQIGKHESIDRNKINAIGDVVGKNLFEIAEVYNNGVTEVK